MEAVHYWRYVTSDVKSAFKTVQQKTVRISELEKKVEHRYNSVIYLVSSDIVQGAYHRYLVAESVRRIAHCTSTKLCCRKDQVTKPLTSLYVTRWQW